MKKKKKKKVIPKRPQPTPIERKYERSMIALVNKDLRRLTKEMLEELQKEEDQMINIRADAKLNSIGNVRTITPVKRVLGKFKTLFDTIIDPKRANLLAQEVSEKTSLFAVKTTENQVRGLMSIPPTQIGTHHQQFIQDNVGLIKSIPEVHFERIGKIIETQWTAGKTTKEIAGNLKDAFGVTERRAKLIAVDQVGKLNAQITQKRHEELGIKKYRWSTVKDERVRGNPNGKYPKVKYSHWEREGKVFKYSEPPPDGHPSYPIRCRCSAIPIIED